MAIFKTTPDLAVLKTVSTFNAVVTTDDASTVTWDFGDGNTESNNTVAHVYSGTQPFLINLIMPDESQLATINASNTNLTAFDISRYSNLLTVDISDNLILGTDIENIILELDTNGLSNGTLDYSGNTGFPSGQSIEDAYDSLLAKGWTITGAVPATTSMRLLVNTSNSGSTANDTFALGMSFIAGSIDIDWGDGSAIENFTTGNPTHEYLLTGEQTIKITGDGSFSGNIVMDNSGDNDKLVDMQDWGTTFTWSPNSSGSFRDCTNMVVTAANTPNFSAVTNLTNFMNNCTALDFIGFEWNAPLVTDMTDCFKDCTSVVTFPQFNTPALFTVNGAFRGCTSLVTMSFIDMSECLNAFRTWRDCSSLVTMPLLNTIKNNNFDQCWQNCTVLTNFPAIVTTALIGANGIFKGCPALTTIHTFDTRIMNNGSNLTDFWITADWSARIIATESENSFNNVQLGGGTSQYNAGAVTARASLVSRGWTVIDGGLEP